MPPLADVWGYLLVALAFFVLGRLSAGRDRAPRMPKPSTPPRASAEAVAPPLAVAFETELRELIARGDLIRAIKRYRDETGADLKTAKDAVFRFQEDLRRRGLA